MELIPLLSTVILAATIVTIVFAAFSYAAYRARERRAPAAPAATGGVFQGEAQFFARFKPRPSRS